jgi:hypothetical protein
MPLRTYHNRFFIFRNPQIRRDIAALDPVKDHKEIVALMGAYEFAWDTTRALELALFHTYAHPRISALLHKTGEFRRHGQKRYDDTALLIGYFLQEGYDSPIGASAIAQMNKLHGHYPIPNEDFVFVLGTFILYPPWWMENYGYRPLTDHEQLAIFHFWVEVGKRMGLKDIPASLGAMKQYMQDTERAHFRYTDDNRAVGDATLDIIRGWLPKWLHFAVKPSVCALLPEVLLEPFGYQRPAGWYVGFLQGCLWLRKQVIRVAQLEKMPTQIYNTLYRSYPGKEKPSPEALGPEKLVKRG